MQGAGKGRCPAKYVTRSEPDLHPRSRLPERAPRRACRAATDRDRAGRAAPDREWDAGDPGPGRADAFALLPGGPLDLPHRTWWRTGTLPPRGMAAGRTAPTSSSSSPDKTWGPRLSGSDWAGVHHRRAYVSVPPTLVPTPGAVTARSSAVRARIRSTTAVSTRWRVPSGSGSSRHAPIRRRNAPIGSPGLPGG